MRTANIEKAELLCRLKAKFKSNEPIFTEEILAEWAEYSRTRVFQLLKELCADGAITKYILGVYYFPETAFWGGLTTLNPAKIAEKRYLQSDGRIFGYYSGLTLLNMLGFTNQVPNVCEIVTVNETTRVREVTIGKAKFLIRRAKAQITDKNAPIFQLLEVFNRVNRPLDKLQKDNLLALTGGKINAALLAECAKYFPKRALQNFNNSELKYVVAQ